MKKTLTIKTRWEYYISNVAGLLIILTLVGWCVYLSFDNGKLELASVSFWIAAILVLMVPFALISFFSSMRSVVVRANELEISYLFRSHKNHIAFSEVKSLKSEVNKLEASKRSTSLRSSFALVLRDGRVFEFTRSQFNDYDQLLSIVERHVRKQDN
jgi:hypothetical protein